LRTSTLQRPLARSAGKQIHDLIVDEEPRRRFSKGFFVHIPDRCEATRDGINLDALHCKNSIVGKKAEQTFDIFSP